MYIVKYILNYYKITNKQEKIIHYIHKEKYFVYINQVQCLLHGNF